MVLIPTSISIIYYYIKNVHLRNERLLASVLGYMNTKRSRAEFVNPEGVYVNYACDLLYSYTR